MNKLVLFALLALMCTSCTDQTQTEIFSSKWYIPALSAEQEATVLVLTSDFKARLTDVCDDFILCSGSYSYTEEEECYHFEWDENCYPFETATVSIISSGKLLFKTKETDPGFFIWPLDEEKERELCNQS